MVTQNLQRLPLKLSAPEAAVVVVSIGLAIVSAVICWFSGIALAAVIVLPILALISFLIFGATGSLLCACAFSSFFLMNRIDEGLVLPFNDVSALKSSYWFVMACAAVLGVMAFFNGLTKGGHSSGKGRFTTQFFALYLGFVAVLLIGGILNHLFDHTFFMRDATGEILASISILSPILFVPLSLYAPLNRPQIVRILQVFIILAGMGGIAMAAFGFLPGRLLSVLGWAAANQGTAGLLRGRLPLGHPNAVAAVLILLLPPSIVLGLIPGGRHFRMFYLGCAVLMFAGILFSLARSALIVTVLVLALTIAYIYFGRGRKTLMTYMLPAFFSICLVGVVAYLFLSFDFSRFWSREGYEDATIERRNMSLTTALYVIKDYPVWGVTPDAMYTRLETRPGWEPPMEDNVSPIYYYNEKMSAETPHNMYLTVLAETGAAGAVFFFGMIVFIFFNLWKLRRTPGLSDEQRHALMGFMLGMVGFLLMGAFESLLMVGLRPAFLFWATAGLTLRYAFELSERNADHATN